MMARDIFENNEVGVFSQDMSEYESGAYTVKFLQICYNLSKQTVLSLVTVKEDNIMEKTDSHCNRKVKLALDKGLTLFIATEKL